MDLSKSFFDVQKKFVKFQKYIIIALAAYYGIVFGFGRYENYLEIGLAVGTIVVLIIDSIIGCKNYFHQRFIFRGLKLLIMLLAAGTMVFNCGIYFTVIVMALLYLCVAIEYLFLFDIVEFYYRVNATVEISAPIAIVALIYYIFSGRTNFEVFLVLAFLVTEVLLIALPLNVVSEILDKLMNEMFRHERIAVNSHKEYENLKVYQSKLVHANEQLSMQKFEMQRLNSSVNIKNNQMDLQYKILKQITSALDIDKILPFITDGIVDNMKVDLCILFVYEIDDNGDIKDSIGNIRYTESSKLSKQTIRLFEEYIKSDEFKESYRNDIVMNNVDNGEFEFLRKSEISSLIMYPIDISVEKQGILVVGKNTSKYFNDENKEFYKAICEQVILAVNNATIYYKMHDMATKDPLTSIYNRRHFNSIYPELIKTAKEKNEPLTVILFDIDKFKNVNDKYGHLFGDQVIRLCGDMAGKFARKNDAVAVRYGGEEFVVVFPGKDISNTMGIIEELHKEIREYEFTFEDKPVSVNVSIGVSSYPETCEDLPELLNRADLAMYHSKNTGRGRITVDSPSVRGEE